MSNGDRTWPGRAPGSRARAATSGVTLLVAGLLAAASTAGAQDRSPTQSDTTLANGLRVTVLENHAVPLASVLVAVRAGAYTQSPGEEGIAHLYEHLLFRSYGEEAGDFSQRAGQLRAYYNGETGTDVVSYFLVLPAEEVDRAIELMADLVSEARFRDDDLEAELPVVLDELARSASSPSERLRRMVSRRLWGDDWYRFDVGGDSLSLGTVTVDRLQERFDRFYVPNNAVLIVTGDADPQDVFHEAAHRFEDWEPGADPVGSEEALEPAADGTATAVLLADDVLEATIQVRIRAPGTVDDVDALRGIDALVELLNDPSGMFQQALVQGGPFELLDVGLVMRRYGSSIVFEGTAAVDRAAQAVQQLATAVGQVESVVPPAAEAAPDGTAAEGTLQRSISVAERRWALDLALTTERTARIAPYMAGLWGRGGGDFLFDESPFETTRDHDALVAVARRYFLEAPKVIGVLGPPNVVEELRTQMGAGVP